MWVRKWSFGCRFLSVLSALFLFSLGATLSAQVVVKPPSPLNVPDISLPLQSATPDSLTLEQLSQELLQEALAQVTELKELRSSLKLLQTQYDALIKSARDADEEARNLMDDMQKEILLWRIVSIGMGVAAVVFSALLLFK
jgi:hypothetical protein